MFDVRFHQGLSLHSTTPQTELRVLAVASQEHSTESHETLWRISAHLQQLGYPVVALDATTPETDESPGLWHLLQDAQGTVGTHLQQMGAASSVAVIPSSIGLGKISQFALHNDISPLLSLVPYFRLYGILVLHAPASMLAPLLPHTASIPLVMMGSEPCAVLDSYKSLKQVALHAGMPCMVAALVREDSAVERQDAQSALTALQDCALRHLGMPLRTTTIAMESPQDLQRLALQLLENAGTINNEVLTSPLLSQPAAHAAHFVRSH